MRRLRTATTVLSMGALLMAVAGCGGNGEEAEPTATAAPSQTYESVTQLAEAIDARLASDGTLHYDIEPGPETPPEAAGTGNGQSEFQDDVTFSATTMQIGAATGNQPGEVEVRQLPPDMFIRLPDGQEPEPGRPWLRIDESNQQDPRYLVFADLLRLTAAAADPSKELEANAQTMTISETSTEQRAGQDVTVYTVDTPQGNAQGQYSFSLRLALNSEDQVLEQAATIESGGGTIGLVVTYSEWGAPVDITAPPGDEVADI